MKLYPLLLIFIISVSGIYHQFAIILCGFFVALYINNLSFIIIESVVKKVFIFSCLLIIIGLINQSDIFLLLEQIIKIWIFVFFFITLKNTMTKECFFNVIIGLSYIIIFSLFLYPFLLHNGRFSSIFAHPNHLAYVVNLLIFCFIFLYNKNYKQLLILFLLTIILFLTNSSGGILCLIGLILTRILLSNKKSLYLLFFILCVALLFLFKDSIPAITTIFDKFNSIDTYELQKKIAMYQFGNDSSLVWRITYWSALIRELFADSLLVVIFGYGAGTMSSGNYLFYWMITDPHNDFVRIILEYGFFGFITFSFYLYLVIKTHKIGFYIIPLLFLPMFVGNIVVNVPYILLFCTILGSLNFKGIVSYVK